MRIVWIAVLARWFCSHLPKCSCKGKCYPGRCARLVSVVWHCRLCKYGHLEFSFVVPRWWNELPSTTRAGASLSTFKKLLKTQLFREHLPSYLALRLVLN